MSNYRSNLTEIFKALSNPHRLEIFYRLSTCCEPGTVCSIDAARMCVSDIGSEMDIAPSTLSHHIKELTRAGLLQTERKGKHVQCWVEPDTIRGLLSFIKESGYE